MAVNDVHKVTVVFTDGITLKNATFGYHLRENSGGDPSISQIGAKVKAWWNDVQGALTPIKALHSTTFALAKVTRRKIDPLSALIEEYTTGLPILGTGDSGETEGSTVCTLLSLRTALAGKRYRGRIHPPALDETHVTGGLLTAAAAQLYANKVKLLFDLHLSVDAMQSVIYSKPLPSSTPIVTPVSLVLADRRPRSMRRRQVRSGLYLTGV